MTFAMRHILALAAFCLATPCLRAQEKPPVAFTVPEAWGYGETDIPRTAQTFIAPGGAFSLYSQEAAKQTVNGRTAVVGVVTGGTGALYGGLGDNGVAATVEADVWMKVLGGAYDRLVGGSNKWASGGKKPVTTKGNLLLEMVGGTTKDIIGGDYGDGAASGGKHTLTGNIAVRIAEGAKVTGSVVVGTIGLHGRASTVTGSATLTVANVQGDNGGSSLGAPGKGYLIAGAAWGGNSGTQSLVGGNAALRVELGDEASGTFVKHLIGGAGHFGSNNGKDSGTNPQTVQGDASVVVKAPAAVAFPGTIVGGAWVDNANGRKGSALVGGDASVTLDGGAYSGTIVAGGHGTHATVSGSATLTLKGGDFAEATLLPGNADGVATLAVRCAAEVKALTAFDVIDLSAEDASLTVRETLTLPAEGTVEVRLPEGTEAGAEFPLTLPEAVATEETLGRLWAVTKTHRYAVATSGGKLVLRHPAVTFNRPATAAWEDVALEAPGTVETRRVSKELWLGGAEAFDVELGGETVSLASVEAHSGKPSVYGGMAFGKEGNLTKPIRLRVGGGAFANVFGGSDCRNWSGAKPSTFGRSILVDMASGRVDYLFGGSWNDGKNQTHKGDIAVALSGDAVVTGSAAGGGTSQHQGTSTYGSKDAPVELSVTVRNAQNDNSCKEALYGAGIGAGFIGGGPMYSANSEGKLSVHGNTAVVVSLPEAERQRFAKALIGGITVPSKGKIGADARLEVSGHASVTVSAPADTTFGRDVSGGHWLPSSVTATPIALGSSAVTLEGGVYEGTVTAGSLGGKNNGLGPATLTVGAKGAIFKGKVQGGVASEKTLALEDTMTLDGGTLELVSFNKVSGAGAVAVKAGMLNVGTVRASEGFGVLQIAEVAEGSVRVIADLTEGASITLPLVGEAITAETLAVASPAGAPVPVKGVEATEAGTVVRFAVPVPPLTAQAVSGAWSELAWQDAEGTPFAPAEANAWTGERSLSLEGDAAVTVDAQLAAEPLTIAGAGTLTLSASGGKLSAKQVAVQADVVVEPKAATLSGVTIAEGKTLTVRDTATLDLTKANAAKGAGTLRMEGVSVTRKALPASGEALLEVGNGSVFSLNADNSGGQIPKPLTVSGNGVLVLGAKDVIGWKPTTEQLRNTRIIARERGIVRKPSGVVESMRCTYEMGGASRLEVGKVNEKGGAYDAGFAMCRGARFIATDGEAGIYGLKDETDPAIALRCTGIGTGIAGEHTFVEFEVREGATFTVDVPLRHYANGSYSNFPVRKTGAGTLALTKANPTADNPLHVEAGTVRLAEGATWADEVVLHGTLAATGTATVAALTLEAGATLDASAGAVTVTGAVTLAEGVTAVPVRLGKEAKAGDVALACAAPSETVAAALKAEGFTVAAAPQGYVLTSGAPTPARPEAFDAQTLARICKDAAARGLKDGFTVEVRGSDKGAVRGDEASAAAALACFDGLVCVADVAENTLAYAYDFGISALRVERAEGLVAAVTVSIAGGAFRPGTTVRLVSTDASAEVLAETPVPERETPGSDLTLTVSLDRLDRRPFTAKVVSPTPAP